MPTSGRYPARFDLDDEKQQDDDDHDDDAVGMPMDDSFRGLGAGEDIADGDGDGDGGGDRAATEGDGHEVRAKTDVAPEWNPYEDSDEEDGGERPN